MSVRWHTDSRVCSHSNDDVCETCDFDRWYANTYPECPWRDKRTSAFGGLHPCVDCGIELDADDPYEQCEDCIPPNREREVPA